MATQKEQKKLVFSTDHSLMQVKSIAECSKGSILQYFRPSLSNHFPLRPLFCLSLSGRLRQVLLYFRLPKYLSMGFQYNGQHKFITLMTVETTVHFLKLLALVNPLLHSLFLDHDIIFYFKTTLKNSRTI